MAFENSPILGEDGVVERRSLRAWLALHRRWLIILAALFLLADAWLIVQLVRPAAPGGLDGCVVTASGQPVVSAIIRAGQVERMTFADGCFFFPSLQPGTYQVSIATDGEVVWSQPVTIISGQAVGLETIRVP